MFRIVQWSDTHHTEGVVNNTQSLMPTIPQVDIPVHCGDIVFDHYPEDIGAFDTTGSTCVIGNHDALDVSGTNKNGYEWYKQPSQEDLYNRYFSRMRTTFGLDMKPNTTWWSKEFADKGILLLGLNDTALDANFDAELAFVHERVAYAESKNLKIVVALHGLLNMTTIVRCNFTSTIAETAEYPNEQEGYTSAYANCGDNLMRPIVQSKCRVLLVISGHTHFDVFGTITRTDSSKIPHVIIGSGIPDKYNDVARGNATRTSFVVCNMIDYVPEMESLRVYRLGADATYGGVSRKMLTFSYGDNRIVSSCGVRN